MSQAERSVKARTKRGAGLAEHMVPLFPRSRSSPRLSGLTVWFLQEPCGAEPVHRNSSGEGSSLMGSIHSPRAKRTEARTASVGLPPSRLCLRFSAVRALEEDRETGKGTVAWGPLEV